MKIAIFAWIWRKISPSIMMLGIIKCSSVTFRLGFFQKPLVTSAFNYIFSGYIYWIVSTFPYGSYIRSHSKHTIILRTKRREKKHPKKFKIFTAWIKTEKKKNRIFILGTNNSTLKVKYVLTLAYKLCSMLQLDLDGVYIEAFVGCFLIRYEYSLLFLSFFSPILVVIYKSMGMGQGINKER